MKRPSFQFYPGDWLNDSSLRMVSVGARGLWIEMLCLMHQGTPYGYLKVNHKVILPSNLARMIGATLHETEGWLVELRESGVFSEDEDGGIFSRRMIRDEEIREKRSSGGKLGGNPLLIAAAKGCGKVATKDNLTPNLRPTPSSSSSSSSSKEITTKINNAGASDGTGLPEGFIAKIIDLWNEKAGCLPIIELTSQQMQRLIFLADMYRDLNWWESLFSRIKQEMPHLQGKNDREWKAGLGWVISAKHWADVLNGQYVTKEVPKNGRNGNGKNGARGGSHADRVNSATFDDSTAERIPDLG